MNPKYVDLRITAISETDLMDFLIALRKIQYCGDVGINRRLPLQIDGDGSGHINVEIHIKPITKPVLENLRDKFTLNQSNIEKVNGGEDFDTHYIGE